MIPVLPWIPEIDRTRWEILYPALFALVVIANVLFVYRNWKNFGYVKWKALIVLLSVTVVVVHSYIFFIIDFKNSFGFISNRVEYKKDLQNKRVYILERQGLFNTFFGSEIIFRNGFSPFYHTHYKTERYIEPIDENPGEWVLREYYYTLGDVDTTVRQLFPKRHRIKTHHKTIRIKSEDLE